MAEYWKALEPVFGWTTAERQRRGYLFLRDEVFPQRTTMLGIADQIGIVNESLLNTGKMRVELTFEQFRRRLTTVIGLTIGLGLLLAAFSIRKILDLESDAAMRYREISQARRNCRNSRRGRWKFRKTKGAPSPRELHDEVGQTLTGTLVEMANLSALIRAGSLESVQLKADEIKKEIETSISVVRNMALLLRPSMLDDLGLVPALQWQAREVAKRSGLRVRVAAEEVSDDLSEEHKTCVYRVVRKRCTTLTQHARAETVRVTVRQEPDRIFLSIQDDGKGFNAREERGMGLIGMEERVSRLGGEFSVTSEPEHGTVVRVVLPPAHDAGRDVRKPMKNDSHSSGRRSYGGAQRAADAAGKPGRVYRGGRRLGWPGDGRAGGEARAGCRCDGRRDADPERNRSGPADLRQAPTDRHRVSEHALGRSLRAQGP